jgi:hypothetical protein
MITVSILINGEPMFTRTAVNRLKELGVYVLDTGERIHHNPDDGAVALAQKMLATIEADPDQLSLCKNCWAMTKTWHGTCGKCKAKKERE